MTRKPRNAVRILIYGTWERVIRELKQPRRLYTHKLSLITNEGIWYRQDLGNGSEHSNAR